MDYITLNMTLDMGIIGQQEVDIEYQILDGKPDLIGVWLYDFCGRNFAADISDLLTDAAHDLIYDAMNVDYESRKNDEAAYALEDR